MNRKCAGVERSEEQRKPLSEHVEPEDREHQEVYTLFEKARQDLNAARRARGLFPVEAVDTGYKVHKAGTGPRLLEKDERRHMPLLREAWSLCSEPSSEHKRDTKRNGTVDTNEPLISRLARFGARPWVAAAEATWMTYQCSQSLKVLRLSQDHMHHWHQSLCKTRDFRQRSKSFCFWR